MPLANGTIWRLPLPLDGGSGNGGPNWRSLHADSDARCYIVMLAEDEFLTSDGSRGITHWKWPAKDTYHAVPPGKTPTIQLARQIASAPLVLPGDVNRPVAICVADQDGTLTLFQGPEWKPVRTWKLGGRITAGPFLRGGRIGCVVDRNQLVWIDPVNAEPAWKFSVTGDGIVGEPQLVNQLLIVADLSGKFIAINPETGKPSGKEYQLAAGAAPVATPVAFGSAEALLPLTDGTVFALPLKPFSSAAAEGPKQ
jgi:hypothetical protein